MRNNPYRENVENCCIYIIGLLLLKISIVFLVSCFVENNRWYEREAAVCREMYLMKMLIIFIRFRRI